MNSKGRARDKIMILNSCLKSTILYRLQYCTWGLKKYKEIDKKVNEVVRRITKNMKGFPNGPLNAMEEDGGLGVEAVSDAAQRRKWKEMVKMLGREMAAKNNMTMHEKVELNKRGMVLEGETSEGEEGEVLPLRVGQCWKRGKVISEVVGLPDNKVEVMDWTYRGKSKNRVEVENIGGYMKYPTGMGSRNWVDREIFREEANGLCELGKDSAKGKKLTCGVISTRDRVVEQEKVRGAVEMGNWVKWKGRKFNKIYTDGSWKKENTVASLLLDNGKVKAGGGLVITDGNWFSPIMVEMDVETGSAFDVETISMMAAYEIARESGYKVEVLPDCLGGIAAMEGRNEGYAGLLAGWKADDNITFTKVKAHPEMWGVKGIWGIDEIGNWMADYVADGGHDGVTTISAKEVLNDISRLARLTLVDKEWNPFVVDIKRRNSRYLMKRYYEERDKYRALRWQAPVWKGTNKSKAQYMLGLNNFIEDRAAVLRLSLGKTWAISMYNYDLCVACGGDRKGLDHALFRCRHLDVATARKKWKQEVNSFVGKMRNNDLKGIIGEIMMKAMNCKGGEFACVGTFREQFVGQLHLGHLKLAAGEERTIWKALKVLGQGARAVMRVYSNAMHGEFGATELRQGPITEHFKVTKQLKEHKDGTPDRRTAKQDKEQEKRSRKPCRKGGVMNPTLSADVLYWEFRAG